MDIADLKQIQELRLDKSANECHDESLGIIRLKIIYRGEGLYFQIGDKALICQISARHSVLIGETLTDWDNGELIDEEARKQIFPTIAKYYKLFCWCDLTMI